MMWILFRELVLMCVFVVMLFLRLLVVGSVVVFCVYVCSCFVR